MQASTAYNFLQYAGKCNVPFFGAKATGAVHYVCADSITFPDMF